MEFTIPLLMLNFLKTAHSPSCQTLSKAFLKYMKVAYLLCCATSLPESSLLFCDDAFCLWAKSVQDNSQEDLTWMANKAYSPVIVAAFKVALLW